MHEGNFTYDIQRHLLDVLVLGKALNRHAVLTSEHVQPVAGVNQPLADLPVARSQIPLRVALHPVGEDREVGLHPPLSGDLGNLLVEPITTGLELDPATASHSRGRHEETLSPRYVLEVAVAHLQFRVAVEPLGNGHVVKETRSVVEEEDDPATILTRRDGREDDILGLVAGGTGDGGGVFHD